MALSWVAKFLLGLAIFGSITSAVSLLLAIIGGVKFRSRSATPASFFPPVSILKPVHGSEKEQYINFRSFFDLDYPDFELLFCARTLKDPAILCAQEVAREFPHVKCRFLASGEPAWINPKVYSMALLAAEAAHDIVLFSDSDIRVRPDYLRQIVQPLADPKVGLVTCIFRGKPTGSLASQLVALNQTVEFSSGVHTANLLDGIKFALGPTLLTHKSVLEAIGGFEPMQDVYADDFYLGNQIHQHGYTVVLSHFIVDHIIFYKTLTAGIKHQVNWMRSTRRSRPAGHVGIVLTYAMPFGILAVFAGYATGHIAFGWWLLFAAMAGRWLQSLIIGYVVMRDPKALSFFWMYPACDLLGFLCWTISNFGNVLRYRGEKYRFLRTGQIKRVGTP